VIIALIIYSSALGDSATLKYSVLIVIGLAIVLGIIPSVCARLLALDAVKHDRLTLNLLAGGSSTTW
jgi:hypothetical protein